MIKTPEQVSQAKSSKHPPCFMRGLNEGWRGEPNMASHSMDIKSQGNATNDIDDTIHAAANDGHHNVEENTSDPKKIDPSLPFKEPATNHIFPAFRVNLLRVKNITLVAVDVTVGS